MNTQDRISKFIPDNTIFVRYFLYLVMVMLLIQLIGYIINCALG
jgi:hypothetical protein